MSKQLPAQKYLMECFDYSKETGLLTWRYRPLAHFNTPRGGVTFNAQNAGKIAGGLDAFGYLRVSVNKIRLRQHRIVFLMEHGWRPEEIDHINGDRSDNRLENLRQVNRSDNNKNQCVNSSNSSGVMGVCRLTNYDAWMVRIGHEGKEIYIGMFRNFRDAVKARKEAEEQYGFHKNHGRRNPQSILNDEVTE